jgi:integrase
MASLTRKGATWYILTYESGTLKKRWLRVGRCSRKKAEEVLRQFETEQINKRFGTADDDDNVTFAEFAQKYLEYSKAMKALQTFRRDDLCARNLVTHFGIGRRLVDIDLRSIEMFTMKRFAEVSPRTVNIELGFIKKLYRYAVRRRYLKRAPFDSIEMVKEVKRPPRFLLQQEIRDLLDAATPWIKPFLMIGVNVGLRKSEILYLKWKHINLEERFITVQSEGEFKTKTRDYRTVPINDGLLDDLLFLKKHWPHPNRNEWLLRSPSQMIYVIGNESLVNETLEWLAV